MLIDMTTLHSLLQAHGLLEHVCLAGISGSTANCHFMHMSQVYNYEELAKQAGCFCRRQEEGAHGAQASGCSWERCC